MEMGWQRNRGEISHGIRICTVEKTGVGWDTYQSRFGRKNDENGFFNAEELLQSVDLEGGEQPHTLSSRPGQLLPAR